MKPKFIFFFGILFIGVNSLAQKFNIINSEDNLGVVDNSGKIIIPAKYENISILEKKSLFILQSKDKTGLADEAGKEILSLKKGITIYDCQNSDSILLITAPKKIELFNFKTKETFEIDEYEENLKFESQTCLLSSEDKIRFLKNGSEGLLQFPQKILLPAIYDKVYLLPEFNPYVLIQKKEKNQFFNYRDNSFSPEFEVPKNFEGFQIDNERCYMSISSVFPAKINNNWSLMTVYGSLFSVEKFDEKLTDFYTASDAGFILTKQNKKYGFMDNSGVINIPCIYDDADWFNDVGAVVKFNGKYGTIDNSGTIQIPFIYDNLIQTKDGYTSTIGRKQAPIDFYGENTNIKVLKNAENKFGFDIGKKYPTEYKYDFAMDFLSGFAAVNIGGKYVSENEFVEGGKWGFAGVTGDLIIPCIYDRVGLFSEGLINVESEGKWGFIDYSGKMIIKNIYDEAGYFSEGLASVAVSGKYGYVDQAGNIIIPLVYEKAATFSNGKALVTKDGKDFYINKKGEPCE